MPRTQITRLPKRGIGETDAMHAILDEALVIHIAYNFENEVHVIPTGFVRIDNCLYVHGSVGSFYLRHWAANVCNVSASVCLLDGLVVAKSVFDSSVNYRSVVIFGNTFPVLDEKLKLASLKAFTEKMLPGRWDDVRQPNATEMQKTLVVGIEIVSITAKVRAGMPVYETEENSLATWAGVIPFKTIKLSPISDQNSVNIPIPKYFEND